MRSKTLPILFLSIFSLTVSTPLFCMDSFYMENKRLKRSSSSPSIRKHSNKEESLRRLNSDLNKKVQLKKAYEKMKEITPPHVIKSKLEKLRLKIPSNPLAEKLVTEMAINQNPTKEVLKLTGIKSPRGENPLQNLFQKNKKVKSPTGQEVVRLYGLDPDTTRGYFRKVFGLDYET